MFVKFLPVILMGKYPKDKILALRITKKENEEDPDPVKDNEFLTLNASGSSILSHNRSDRAHLFSLLKRVIDDHGKGFEGKIDYHFEPVVHIDDVTLVITHTAMIGGMFVDENGGYVIYMNNYLKCDQWYKIN